MRFSESPLYASRETIDILVALDKASIEVHEEEVSRDGMIIYDASALKEPRDGPQFLNVPFMDLAVQHGGRIMANTVATGAVIGMLGMGFDLLLETITRTLEKKGTETVTANVNAARAGYDYAVRECLRCAFSVAPVGAGKMLIAGNDAIGFGAIAAGCKFYAAYPMTPSTGIMNFIAGQASKCGIVVEQAEDEIAAINMIIGASFGGVRAMTGSSGGGFALMVEGLSLAAMTETPVVIALAQRPAPATGLPTRTEQADLLFALHAGHGEFPRVIFAPGNPEQAFYLTHKAFDLAEKYQIPAFILTDQYLADSEWTCEHFDLDRMKYTDYRLRGDVLRDLPNYRRHEYTETGATPLAIPGETTHLVVTDSDEHDEEGHLTEDGQIRNKMVDKRLFRKLPRIAAEIAPPLAYGHEEPEMVLVGWGSTYGPMRESVDLLGRTTKIAMLHFSEVYPLPLRNEFDYIAFLGKARQTICIENNAMGQFASLVKAETGYEFKDKINRFDGRPFTVDSLVKEIKKRMKGEE
jgi:2-oxoglutarate ferredoxin oxidoreductase subunit alpha